MKRENKQQYIRTFSTVEQDNDWSTFDANFAVDKDQEHPIYQYSPRENELPSNIPSTQAEEEDKWVLFNDRSQDDKINSINKQGV